MARAKGQTCQSRKPTEAGSPKPPTDKWEDFTGYKVREWIGQFIIVTQPADEAFEWTVEMDLAFDKTVWLVPSLNRARVHSFLIYVPFLGLKLTIPAINSHIHLARQYLLEMEQIYLNDFNQDPHPAPCRPEEKGQKNLKRYHIIYITLVDFIKQIGKNPK